MTATSTTELEAMLAARKAAITASEPISTTEAEVVADVVTGEIVPASDREVAPPVIPAPAPDPVVIYPEVPPKVVGGLPYIREYVKLANTIMLTEMVPKAFQGRYDAITAAFMRGYELGLGPMQALDSFNVIEGKVGLSAEAMRALIMQAGHLFVLSEGEGYAEVTARRKDWPADMTTVYRYDMEDAEKAQLLRVPQSGRKGGWQKNPRAMLAARATSGAARAYFADVLAGMSYTPEEIRDFTDEGEAPTWRTPPVASTSSSVTPTDPPAAAVEQQTPETSPSSELSSEPPKRPRGRPRKATTPPVEAPVLELTSLNAPEPEPPAFEPSPGEGGVLIQTRQALSAIIKGLPTAQQPACRAFISQHFPGLNAVDLTGDELQKCIDIAAGWPDSAAQHPLPGEDDPELFPYGDADG
jgi:RecT family